MPTQMKQVQTFDSSHFYKCQIMYMCEMMYMLFLSVLVELAGRKQPNHQPLAGA